jgi:4-aminobutyrate aminotransferase-like enzyme
MGGIDGNVIRFQPPLVISKQQIDQAIDIFAKALRETASSMH